MRTFVVLFSILFSQFAFAEDLPNNHLFKRYSSPMTLYGVKSATIVKKEEKVGTSQAGDKYTTVDAIVEVKVRIEGNLCGGNPDDASYSSTFKQKSESEIQFFRSSVKEDPYDLIRHGCFAYSATRDAVLALRASVRSKNDEVDSQTFLFNTKEMTEKEGLKPVLKKVVFKYSTAKGAEVVIE